ncbi:hypothetical protein NVP1244A_049 [Vibrio phage 1.244.A._10N.261.54.C3]|nr:hypothetical protein NVP1244A_049 [Vibrio phage 1.244.A._10N.261.54.C3]AUR98677.1 hypothetical protein NVP1255O_049 [Vibrio phage 1.255.O._10N.286.45.F1]
MFKELWNDLLSLCKRVFNSLSGCVLFIDMDGLAVLWDMRLGRWVDHGYSLDLCLNGQVRMYDLNRGINGWLVHNSALYDDTLVVQNVSTSIKNFEGLVGGIICPRL